MAKASLLCPCLIVLFLVALETGNFSFVVDPLLIAKVYNAFALVAKNIASMDVAFAIAINSLEIKMKMEMFDN
ncbi:hypothetical protein ACSQ67_011875 [Phaseolus vulgaris]